MGIGFLGVDLHFGHGLHDPVVVDLAFVRQSAEGAEGDVARVDLEMVAQRLAAVAAAEAAVGLALVIAVYRDRDSVVAEELDTLKY